MAMGFAFPAPLQNLRVIGVEEHISAPPELMSRFPASDPVVVFIKQTAAGIDKSLTTSEYTRGRLGVAELASTRLRDMDDNGVAFQILSRSALVGTTTIADGTAASELASELNDALHEAIEDFPHRFAALGELPFQHPELAAQELRRCITELNFKGIMLCGSVGGQGLFLDDPQFDGLLSVFEELDVPLFLHPGIAPKAVVDSYFTFPGDQRLTSLLAGPGWGWHSEVAIHVLRLAVSGTLDRHPKLKLVIGHQGEMLPMMLQRADDVFNAESFGFKRSVAEMLRQQIWVAISGLFTIAETLIAVQRWGVDKVLFANDYPFVEMQKVVKFVEDLSGVLAPEDVRKICQTNAEALFKIRT